MWWLSAQTTWRLGRCCSEGRGKLYDGPRVFLQLFFPLYGGRRFLTLYHQQSFSDTHTFGRS